MMMPVARSGWWIRSVAWACRHRVAGARAYAKWAWRRRDRDLDRFLEGMRFHPGFTVADAEWFLKCVMEVEDNHERSD